MADTDIPDEGDLNALIAAIATKMNAKATATQGSKADTALQPTIVDAKGDLIVGTGADTVTRLPVGSDNTVPVAVSEESSGVKWLAPDAIPQAINAQTGTTYTLVASDAGKLVTLSNAAAITVFLPQDSDATFAVGTRVDFAIIGAGMATFVAGTGATANGTPSLVTRAQWSACTAIKRAANTWLVVGDLA